MSGPQGNPSEDEREVYRVWFDDPSGQRRCVDVPRRKGIASIFDGVWVDTDWQYAVGLDAFHWVPPSRFVLVSKLDKLETIDG